MFRISNDKIASDEFKLTHFAKIVETLKFIKDDKPKLLTKAKDVLKRIHETKKILEKEKVDDNKMESLTELRRELWRFLCATDPSTFALTKSQITRLKKLRKAITKIQNILDSWKEADYNLDDLDNEDCPLVKKKKLEGLLLKYWKEHETILGRCPEQTGGYIKKFVYQNSKLPPKVNEAVVGYFQAYLKKVEKFEDAVGRVRGNTANKKEVPMIDITGLMKFLQSEIDNSVPNFQLNNELVDEIFTDLIKEQKRRRWFQFSDQQFYYSFQNSSHIKIDENSENLNKKLQANKDKRENDLDKLMEEFTEKQRQQDGDEELIEGFDDNNLVKLDNDDTEDEEESEDLQVDDFL